jgi:(2Fe-2S) ferredoxin
MSELKFDKHIFICTNQRAAGEKQSCGEAHGMALVAAFKKSIKDKNLNIKVRAQRAGCLDVCIYGPTLVVYPEGIFYVGVELKDVEEIVESHIVNDTPVERLRLKKEQF